MDISVFISVIPVIMDSDAEKNAAVSTAIM